MNQEVFKTNIFLAVILPVIVTLVLLVIYFVVGVPVWFLLFLVIPVLMVVSGQKEKLVLEDDRLRYEKVFGGEEVSL